MIHFVFEQLTEDNLLLNLTNCPDATSSGIKRFTVSPVVSSLIRCWQVDYKHRHTEDIITYSFNAPSEGNYIIPVGVAHSPTDWCGPIELANDLQPVKNLFCHLSESYLQDLQNGRAFLLLDQTHEGYQTTWLWEWFIKSCELFNVNPHQIIYLTGNTNAGKQYDDWAELTGNTKNKMLVIPHAHFENVVYEISTGYQHPRMFPPGITEKRQLPDTTSHLEYKASNPANIKMFNILQKRPRAHRMWFFKHIFDAGLVENNIVSMNHFNYEMTYYENRKMEKEDCERITAVLPLVPKENPANYNKDNFESGDGGIYILSLNDRTMLDSWCTVVSEASYGKSDFSCFLSEKTFKPIACSHPFIIVGSKGSLVNLRKMGYKTFNPFIDESYDELDDWERMEAITKEMQRLNSMTYDERTTWFNGLADILQYNYNVLSLNYSNHFFNLVKIFNNHIKN